MGEDRHQAELDLLWYADALLLLETLQIQLDDLVAPTCAKWSHIGATRGRPGNPTATRALKRDDLHRKVEPARRVVAWVSGWVATLAFEDRVLVKVRYGLADGEPAPIQYAATAAGIPCEDEEQAAAVQARLDALMDQAARWRGGQVA